MALESAIFRQKSLHIFSDIVELPVKVPRYSTCHTSVVATGKKVSAPGELSYLLGVAIHKEIIRYS